MKISTKGQYALEIVVDLAVTVGSEQLESLRNIADRRKLSEKYLERIIKELKQRGIVKSVRGAHGGYCLGKPPKDITIKEVLVAVEGELAPVRCLTGESDCEFSCDLCPTRSTWGDLWEIILNATNGITIEQIIRRKEEIEAGS